MKKKVFHQKSEDILHSLFAGTENHKMRALPFAGNTLRFRGKFQYIFQTKFFPLEFEGISYNNVYFVSLNLSVPGFFLLCFLK